MEGGKRPPANADQFAGRKKRKRKTRNEVG